MCITNKILQNVRSHTNQSEKDTTIEKWAEHKNRQFIRKELQIVNKNMKIQSTSHLIRKMHSKIPMYNLYSLNLTKITKF